MKLCKSTDTCFFMNETLNNKIGMLHMGKHKLQHCSGVKNHY